MSNLSDDTLLSQIYAERETGETITTRLETDDRVIARVTDGIYRQPGSALRELISNAYDADAAHIYIDTDAPRFSKITIVDDGRGMTPEVLTHLLHHIGGSAKRTNLGADLGIVDPNDPTITPKGRKLIGKIGIGLFSIAQLTHSFQIVTKVAGDPFRTVATVKLKTYADDVDSQQEGNEKFEAGIVNIKSEVAIDVDSQGTTIVLTNLWPQTRDTLRSKGIWDSVSESKKAIEEDSDKEPLLPPKFHIGVVDPKGEILSETSNLPWMADDCADERFRKLVNCVWNEVGLSNPNPKLENLFDYYLQMIWSLSLSAPLPYVEMHPFDFDNRPAEIQSYLLSNSPKGQAVLLPEDKNEQRKILSLQEGSRAQDSFDIVIDGLQLMRPIRFSNLPLTDTAVKHPLMFFGKCDQNFSNIDKSVSGGELSFEAYLLWTPKVAPREHRGSLIRIHGSSGSLFDETFMRYQVSESTRLSQITCEIFVHKGLDGALNIDRESFNFAHPHYVFISKWLHSTLRQLATVHKRIGAELRIQNTEKQTDKAISKLQTLVEAEWRSISDDLIDEPPVVIFDDKANSSSRTSSIGGFSFDRKEVFESVITRKTNSKVAEQKIVEEKLKAISQLLAAYGLLDNLSKAKQVRLLKAIAKIIDSDAE